VARALVRAASRLSRRLFVCENSKASVEMSLDTARTSARVTIELDWLNVPSCTLPAIHGGDNLRPSGRDRDHLQRIRESGESCAGSSGQTRLLQRGSLDRGAEEGSGMRDLYFGRNFPEGKSWRRDILFFVPRNVAISTSAQWRVSLAAILLAIFLRSLPPARNLFFPKTFFRSCRIDVWSVIARARSPPCRC